MLLNRMPPTQTLQRIDPGAGANSTRATSAKGRPARGGLGVTERTSIRTPPGAPCAEDAPIDAAANVAAASAASQLIIGSGYAPRRAGARAVGVGRPREAQPLSRALLSAAAVSGPTLPSTERPFACWNATTAASVRGPKVPSAEPGSNPALDRARWSSRTTAGSFSPSWSFVPSGSAKAGVPPGDGAVVCGVVEVLGDVVAGGEEAPVSVVGVVVMVVVVLVSGAGVSAV